jgi:kumamolisin
MAKIITAVAGFMALTATGFCQAQGPEGSIVVPMSSIERAGDLGKRAHTNVSVFVPLDDFKSRRAVAAAAGGPPFSGLFFETPASVACVYGLVTTVEGCNPTTVTVSASGGSNAMAIVDAYDDPSAVDDLTTFSSRFRLPAPNLQVVYASGTNPGRDCTLYNEKGNCIEYGWELEESLDVQWAHAMAPNAEIYLVEAASNSFSDLFTAVQVAGNLIAAAGGGEVSMSWSGEDFFGENSYDSYFTTPGVVYFGAAGDAPGPVYPSTSPNVVAVGGTTLRRDPLSGNFIDETTWPYAGGGLTFNEATPSYQSGLSSLLLGGRGVPDLAAVADPNTGVWIYDTGNKGYCIVGSAWCILGGTSAATPVLAGIVNLAGHFAASTNAELTMVYTYNNTGKNHNVTDIAKGFCGYQMQDSATKGWDFCTGVGSPAGLQGK